MGLWKSIQLTATESDFPIFTKAGTPDRPVFPTMKSHSAPNRSEQGDAIKLMSQLCASPPHLTITSQGFKIFAMKKMHSLGMAIWPPPIFVHFTEELFWGNLQYLSCYPETSTRLCPSHLMRAPYDQPQAFKEGNGRIRNWPIISSTEALATLSLSADRSCFFKYSSLSSGYTWMLSDTKAHSWSSKKNSIWALH